MPLACWKTYFTSSTHPLRPLSRYAQHLARPAAGSATACVYSPSANARPKREKRVDPSRPRRSAASLFSAASAETEGSVELSTSFLLGESGCRGARGGAQHRRAGAKYPAPQGRSCLDGREGDRCAAYHGVPRVRFHVLPTPHMQAGSGGSGGGDFLRACVRGGGFGGREMGAPPTDQSSHPSQEETYGARNAWAHDLHVQP